MNAPVHAFVGGVAGLAYGTTRPGQTEDYGALVEMAGALLGGIAGGLLPDILEPALNNPRHRSLAHSFAAGGGIAALHLKLDVWQTGLGRRALEYRQKKETAQDELQRFLFLMGEIFYFAFAGFIAGVIAGYVSHLVLDMFTPAGLPLIVNGF